MVHEWKESMYRNRIYRLNGTGMKIKNVQLFYVQVKWYMKNERCTGWMVNEWTEIMYRCRLYRLDGK